MISTALFTCSVVVDYKAFQRLIDQEDRNLVRLRWEILIFTPTEDLVHIILGFYLFIHSVTDFLTYLCIVFSVGMIIARLFKVFVAKQGGLREAPRPSNASTIVGGMQDVSSLEVQGS